MEIKSNDCFQTLLSIFNLRPSSKGDSLEVLETPVEFSRSELKTLMAGVARGNDSTGGVEVLAQGSGVVTFIQLSATR